MDHDEESFEPRDYQNILAEQAYDNNKILFLPTGSGKTYISIMVLRRLFHQLTRPFDEGGKRAVFLVNTVALVEQQAKVLKRHIQVKDVGQFSGDMNVDSWTREVWLEQLRAYEVLVMTAEIFKILLLKKIISFQQVALLILDECHHAVEDHPMRQIMRELKDCQDEQPRVLGLTATLLNKNPKDIRKLEDAVRLLEVTLHSTIATVNSWELVKKFSTKPKQTIIPFTHHFCLSDRINDVVDNMVNVYENVQFCLAGPSEGNKLKDGFSYLTKQKKNYIKNLVLQVSKQYQSLGPYGAWKTALSVSTTLHTITLKTEDKDTKLALMSILTSLSLIRCLLDIKMVESPEESVRALECTTPKVVKLLCLLKEHHSKFEEKKIGLEDSARVLIFVQERMTAKILSSILKNAGRNNEYNFIKTSFMVGQTFDPLNESWEASFVKTNNMNTVQKFRDGELNILVCSDVLEEGIDIPLCNMVIKFDDVLSFRSYIQSKGRARNENSLFCLMVESTRVSEMHEKVAYFNTIEKKLVQLLVGKTYLRESPTEAELKDLYDVELPPYVTPSGAKVTMTSAISLVNGFSMSLARDRFSQFLPTWGKRKNCGLFEKEGFIVCVQLPQTSTFKSVIEGPVMLTLKAAKRAAALELCKKLHQAGEITDNLAVSEFSLPAKETNDLFPCWDDESSTSNPGTKTQIREYKPFKPKCRVGSAIKGQFYVYNIDMIPDRTPAMDPSTRFVRGLFHGSQQFALLSSTELKEVGSFPVFFKFGEIQVHLRERGLCMLTDIEVKKIKGYHFKLFTSILPWAKSFMYFDGARNNNLFLITPIREEGSVITIDWSAMQCGLSEHSIESPETALGCVIRPTHRTFNSQEVFIVCKVSTDVTARTAFPNANYKDYCDYFKKKYDLEVSQPNLPLLQVVSLMINSDAMLPRYRKETDDYGSLGHHFTQHFPSEMCNKNTLSASLFVQAILLPTVLHRLERLLVADDLRRLIAEETGIGSVYLPHGEKWRGLKSSIKISTSIHSESQTVHWKEQLSNLPHNQLETLSLWELPGVDNPIDIEREFENVSSKHIEDYVKFTCAKMSVEKSPYRAQNKPISSGCKKDPSSPVAKIKCLRAECGLGPHPCDIYAAITAASSNDIVDYERFETLGDSFLKFAVSLFLFVRYSNMSEGQCTQVKGKLLGNRNLFYCARNKSLGSYLKVKRQVPWDSSPPHFSIPKDIVSSVETCPARGLLLQKVVLCDEERENGILFPQTLENFNTLTKNEVINYRFPFEESQAVNDKVIADSVEALIGCYLQHCGPRAALILLEWFKVLPKFVHENIKTRDLLTISIHQPKAIFVLEKEGLEDCLGYRFKNPSIMLEAITHSSFPGNQKSYERLEFIGDALLDFLITSYIFENCGELSPGELTDLRSALVNNITFACLTVRYGFYKFLLSASPALFNCIDRFVTFQENRRHLIDDEVLILLEEDESKLAETVDVPKALGDIFEALAGAVFIDSGNSLETVWSVFYALMKTEINAFSKKVPKQVVRRLYEAIPNGVKLRVSTHKSLITQTMVELEVTLNGKVKYFNGFGENKAQAKKSAAKLALRDLAVVS